MIIDNIHTWHTISVQTNHDLGSRLYCMIEYVGKEVKHLQGDLKHDSLHSFLFSFWWNIILNLTVEACYKKINLYPKLLRETNQPIDRLNASQSVLQKNLNSSKKRKDKDPFSFNWSAIQKFSLNISLPLNTKKCNNR